MITPTELVAQLRAFKEEYQRQRIDLFLSTANNANALMKIRVIKDKVNSEGTIFGLYAESTIKKKGTRVAEGATVGAGQEGPTDTRINFSDTNRMWAGDKKDPEKRGVQAKLLVSDANKVTIVIQPENDTDRVEVLGILEGKYGPIVAWSQDEQKLLIEIWEEEFEALKNRFGF